MSLRRADVCARCGIAIDAGTPAEWNPDARVVTCMACVERREDVSCEDAGAALERGSPGASARRMYEDLRSKREAAARKKLGRQVGRVYLALSTEPHSTRAWGVGGRGERLLGEFLESLDDESRMIVLHDRRIPGSRANIDHIAICRSGVYAIDAKNYSGTVQRIDKGGWFSSDARLYVGRRDCTKLVTGMEKQVAAIQAALADEPGSQAIEVKAALCFVDAEWSLFAKPFALDGVWIGWAKALGERLLADGPIAPSRLVELAERLAARLPAA
jgi:hypothetical protein